MLVPRGTSRSSTTTSATSAGDQERPRRHRPRRPAPARHDPLARLRRSRIANLGLRAATCQTSSASKPRPFARARMRSFEIASAGPVRSRSSPSPMTGCAVRRTSSSRRRRSRCAHRRPYVARPRRRPARQAGWRESDQARFRRYLPAQRQETITDEPAGSWLAGSLRFHSLEIANHRCRRQLVIDGQPADATTTITTRRQAYRLVRHRMSTRFAGSIVDSGRRARRRVGSHREEEFGTRPTLLTTPTAGFSRQPVFTGGGSRSW